CRRAAHPHRPLHRRPHGGAGVRERRPAGAAGLHSLSMIHVTRAIVRRWLDTLLHIQDTPERTAAAFALGVFFGFSPFLGLHTVLGILFAFLVTVHRVAG